MFTCGPTFFVASGSGGPLPPAPTTHTMDYVFAAEPFVVMAISGLSTQTMDLVYEAEPYFIQ